MIVRLRIRVRGTVQGVGFRPFVATLAARLGLAGTIRNDSEGVLVEVEGPDAEVQAFVAALGTEAPPLSVVEDVEVTPVPPQGTTGFVIDASADTGARFTTIPPDVALCDDCRRELRDPADRRYRYPFINCTHCGPRYTIVTAIPYDRAATTMARFRMCATCQQEYDSPVSRRYHAQPNACATCGPSLEWRAAGDRTHGEGALREARRALENGSIVAVKGIGGFHLACLATDREVVRRLRQRKGRSEKPLAVMAPSVEVARHFASVSPDDARLLQSRQRPIVILHRRLAPAMALAAEVAPGHDTIGVMLPYSPLHELLLDGDLVLVMTSGNLSEEPIVTNNDDALARLAHIADGFLLHNRDIHVATDDSVVRHVEGRELPVRRSRGYAPFPVRLAEPLPSVFATGGDLKTTACLTKGRYAFLSQHIGDLGNVETLDALDRACRHLQRLFDVRPELVVCDLHPDYHSTRWAQQLARERELPLIRVQHHHAHLVSLLADRGRPLVSPTLSFVFDGTGFGTDGTIWGGEVLCGDATGFERLAHLAATFLPGGDAGVRHPSRIALAQLHAAGVQLDHDLPPVAACDGQERRILEQQLTRRVGGTATTSMGRFFDAVASIIDVRHHVSYEGQAAIELEALARRASGPVRPYDWGTAPGARELVFDGGAILRAVVDDLRAGTAPQIIAARVHESVAWLIADVADALRDRTTDGYVGLTGGVFQNVLLLSRAIELLRARGLKPLAHHVVPPNDGGLALGQALIGAMGQRQRLR